MNRKTDNKIILVTQKTRLENLIYRYNTESQAKFYIEHHGGNFEDYSNEHKTYKAAVNMAAAFLESYGRLQIVDKENVPNLIFGKSDTVVAVGRDGLVANVLKYLDGQNLIGVNPDPKRWDGVLLPFAAEDLPLVVPEAVENKRQIQNISIAQATLNDGQSILGVNDLFIGQRSHVSARYEIAINERHEAQSSSGIIVSTGLGATGWLKSIIAGARGINSFFGDNSALVLPENFGRNSNHLYFTVREPYPSTSTGADIVFGRIDNNSPLEITSYMPEGGVIFSDGIESDYLMFNSGMIATINMAEKQGRLVV